MNEENFDQDKYNKETSEIKKKIPEELHSVVDSPLLRDHFGNISSGSKHYYNKDTIESLKEFYTH